MCILIFSSTAVNGWLRNGILHVWKAIHITVKNCLCCREALEKFLNYHKKTWMFHHHSFWESPLYLLRIGLCTLFYIPLPYVNPLLRKHSIGIYIRRNDCMKVGNYRNVKFISQLLTFLSHCRLWLSYSGQGIKFCFDTCVPTSVWNTPTPSRAKPKGFQSWNIINSNNIYRMF